MEKAFAIKPDGLAEEDWMSARGLRHRAGGWQWRVQACANRSSLFHVLPHSNFRYAPDRAFREKSPASAFIMALLTTGWEAKRNQRKDDKRLLCRTKILHVYP